MRGCLAAATDFHCCLARLPLLLRLLLQMLMLLLPSLVVHLQLQSPSPLSAPKKTRR